MAKETVVKGLIYVKDSVDGNTKPTFPITTTDMVYSDIENGITIEEAIHGGPIADNSIEYNNIYSEVSPNASDIGAIKVDLPFDTTDDVNVNIGINVTGANVGQSTSLYMMNEGSSFDISPGTTANVYEMSGDGRLIFISTRKPSSSIVIGPVYKLYKVATSMLNHIELSFKYITEPKDAKFSKDSSTLIVVGDDDSGVSYLEIYDVSDDTPTLLSAHANIFGYTDNGTFTLLDVNKFDTVSLNVNDTKSLICATSDANRCTRFYRYDIPGDVAVATADGIASGESYRMAVIENGEYIGLSFTIPSTMADLTEGEFIVSYSDERDYVYIYKHDSVAKVSASITDTTTNTLLSSDRSFPCKEDTTVRLDGYGGAILLASPNSTRIVTSTDGFIFDIYALNSIDMVYEHIGQSDDGTDIINASNFAGIMSVKFTPDNNIIALIRFVLMEPIDSLIYLGIDSQHNVTTTAVHDIYNAYGLTNLAKITDVSVVPVTAYYPTKTNKDIVLIGKSSAGNSNAIVRITDPFDETADGHSVIVEEGTAKVSDALSKVLIHPSNGFAYCAMENVSTYSIIPYFIIFGGADPMVMSSPLTTGSIPQGSILHVSANGEAIISGTGGVIPTIYRKVSGVYRKIPITLHANLTVGTTVTALIGAKFVGNGNWLVMAHNTSAGQCKLSVNYYNGTTYVPIGASNPTTGRCQKMFMSKSVVSGSTTYVCVGLSLSTDSLSIYRINLTSTAATFNSMLYEMLDAVDNMLFTDDLTKFVTFERGDASNAPIRVFSMSLTSGSPSYNDIVDITPTIYPTYTSMVPSMSAISKTAERIYVKSTSSREGYLRTFIVNYSTNTITDVSSLNSSLLTAEPTVLVADTTNDALYIGDRVNGVRRYIIGSTGKLFPISADISLRDATSLVVNETGSILIGNRTRYPYTILMGALNAYQSGKLYITGRITGGRWSDMSMSTNNSTFTNMVKLGYDESINKATIIIGDTESSWINAGIQITNLVVTGQNIKFSDYSTGYDMTIVNNNQYFDDNFVLSGTPYTTIGGDFIDRARISNYVIKPTDWTELMPGVCVVLIYHHAIVSTSTTLVTLADSESTHIAAVAGLSASVNEYDGYCMLSSANIPTDSIRVNIDIIN